MMSDIFNGHHIATTTTGDYPHRVHTANLNKMTTATISGDVYCIYYNYDLSPPTGTRMVHQGVTSPTTTMYSPDRVTII